LKTKIWKRYFYAGKQEGGPMSEELKKEQVENTTEENTEKKSGELSPTWAQDALADLDDWIEEQGIYIRQ
jgi:hypothetical protein